MTYKIPLKTKREICKRAAKKKPLKTMQLSLAKLREEGYVTAITEHYNTWAKIRQDLFGIFDILAVHPEKGILGLQVTSVSNMSSRAKKILAAEVYGPWKATGARIEVWGWEKRPFRVKAPIEWKVRVM